MTTSALATELEAVNLMLSQIDEAPVNSLNTNNVDVALAKQILDENVRSVLGEGWRWNTDYNFRLAPDVDGKITFANVLSLEVDQTWSVMAVLRGTKLYNANGGTYVFADAVIANKIVWLLAWSDLPQQARHYIAIRAARTFQRRLQGSATIERMSQMEEAVGRAELERLDDSLAQYTSLENPQARRTLRRA